MHSGTEIQSVPKELVQFIKTGSRFIIAGHKEPDGDCAGSQLALKSAITRLGKKADVYSAGPFKRTELRNFTEHFVSVLPLEDKSGARVIIVDCSGRERTGDIKDFLDEYPCAVIDHHSAVTHPPSTPQAPVYVDANSPSCTLLIYKLISALGLVLTEEEAIFLLFGLCTDTGFFRHMTEKSSPVFKAAAEMISCGASPKKIFDMINGGKSLNSRILMGRVLSRTESHFEGRLLLSYETLEEFNTFGYENRDSDTLNQMLTSVVGVEAIVIIRQELADNCTVSLRSVDKINVAQIAASFGGGGHKNAAGLTMKGEIPYVKKCILESFSKVIEN
jgi:phosphoesterase RecJ-like protein